MHDQTGLDRVKRTGYPPAGRPFALTFSEPYSSRSNNLASDIPHISKKLKMAAMTVIRIRSYRPSSAETPGIELRTIYSRVSPSEAQDRLANLQRTIGFTVASAEISCLSANISGSYDVNWINPILRGLMSDMPHRPINRKSEHLCRRVSRRGSDLWSRTSKACVSLQGLRVTTRSTPSWRIRMPPSRSAQPNREVHRWAIRNISHQSVDITQREHQSPAIRSSRSMICSSSAGLK